MEDNFLNWIDSKIAYYKNEDLSGTGSIRLVVYERVRKEYLSRPRNTTHDTETKNLTDGLDEN